MKIKLTSVLVVASLVLAACGSDEPPPQSAPVAPRPKAAANPADPTARMARPYVQGKSTAAVDLKYDLLSKPEPGKPVEVDLALIASAVSDSMTVAATSGTPGLEIVDGASASFGHMKIDEIVKHKVIARADKADVYYFTVTATLVAAGTTSARTFSIPLIVASPAGPAPAAASAPLAKPDAGQKVESMPAKETK